MYPCAAIIKRLAANNSSSLAHIPQGLLLMCSREPHPSPCMINCSSALSHAPKMQTATLRHSALAETAHKKQHMFTQPNRPIPAHHQKQRTCLQFAARRGEKFQQQLWALRCTPRTMSLAGVHVRVSHTAHCHCIGSLTGLSLLAACVPTAMHTLSTVSINIHSNQSCCDPTPTCEPSWSQTLAAKAKSTDNNTPRPELVSHQHATLQRCCADTHIAA